MRSSALAARVQRTVEHHQLFGSGDRLVIGVSAGADSTALAHVLPAVARGLGAEVVALAHLNHQLRPDAAEDEAFCAALADTLALPLVLDRVDVSAESRRLRTSIEDAGRIVRYAFLKDAAAEFGASRVAVAHTVNDQAETLLLRLLRGAGPVGLAGIYPQAGPVVRPLIDATRAEVEHYLRDSAICWREDETNRDVTIPRNRVRHELLPWLRQHFGAAVETVIARQAVVFREDADRLDAEATETARALVLENSASSTELPLPWLLDQSPALARRVLLAILRKRANGRFIGLQHVDLVWDVARGADRRAVVDLPGQRLERIDNVLRFQTVEADPLRRGQRRGRPQ